MEAQETTQPQDNCSVLLPHNKKTSEESQRENDIFCYSPDQSLDEILYIRCNTRPFYSPGIKKVISLCLEK
jgi:hypothetical protein